jgi:HEAT repeat protein
MLRATAALVILLSLLSLPAAPQDASSQSPKDRKKAAEQLGQQGQEALPQLDKMLSDTDSNVRLEAVKSIVKIDTDQSLDPLVRATRDNDPEVQSWATAGLVNFYWPGYVQTGFTASLRRAGTSVKGWFTDTNDQVIDPFVPVRPDVIEALGRLARGGASMEARAGAARAVGILRGKAAVPDLLQAVRSKNTQVMYESLVALQKIRDESAGPSVAYLMSDPDKKVQAAAVETAGLLNNREALPRLRELLKGDSQKEVRRAALTSIGMLRDPADRDLFKRYLRDKDDHLRGAAAEGLGRIADPADLPVLEEAFTEEQKNEARVSIAFALVMLGKLEMSELSPFQYLVNTLNSSARAGEAKALLIEAARKPDVLRALEKPLLQGTTDEKIYLSQVMARSGDKDTIPLLDKLTHDPDTKVDEEALRAFRTLKARFP